MLFSKNTIIRIISIAILSSVAIAFPLWLNQNDFILVGFSLGIEPFLLLFASLVAIFCFPQKRYLYLIFLLVLILCCAANFTRLQIWLFHLSGVLCLIGLEKDEKNILRLLRFGIAAAYFWGGLNKINPWFAEFQLEWLLEKPDFLQIFSNSKIVGYGIGIFEFLISILLIFNKLPKITLLCSILFHVFILLMISPFGKNWNYVVVPWNLVFIYFNYYLYQKKENSFFLLNPTEIALIFLFFLFPAFQYTTIGQYPLSFNMYAATQPEATFYFHESDENKIPKSIKEFVYIPDNQQNTIRLLKLQDWAMNSVNTPAFSETWALKAYAQKFCNCLALPDSAGVEILTVKRWDLNSAKVEKINCRTLLSK